MDRPPGWSHPRAMREYLRSIAPDVRRAAAVDRAVQKEVAKINRTDQMIEQIQAPMVGSTSIDLVGQVTIHPSSVAGAIQRGETAFETKPMESNKTGFGNFKSLFGEGLGNLKKIASDLDEEMRSVVAEGQQVAESGKQITEAARREIAEARAALAQFSNGAPE